jgi:integration host factor subunit alpha
MTLKKSTIVDAIQRELGFSKTQGQNLVENLLSIIKRSLSAGDEVMISGFGKFCVKEKSARKGRNPATGDDLMLAPRRVVTFKCSGRLRDKINR